MDRNRIIIIAVLLVCTVLALPFAVALGESISGEIPRYHKYSFYVYIGSVAVVSQSIPVSRCFRFTWLGPKFNNESIFLNATCQEATRLTSGVPCAQPLVASYDGTWPDVEYIWTHHSRDASCILGPNDVCAKYTYYFDGHVENSTYLCTRAVDSFGAAVTSGCYQHRNGSFATRVCFCRSVPGGVPCNEAPLTSLLSLQIFILAIVLIISQSVA